MQRQKNNLEISREIWIWLLFCLVRKAKEGSWVARELNLLKSIFIRQIEIDNQGRKDPVKNSFTSSFLFHYLEISR